MQVWYSQERHGTTSVYTVGKFDGLVLIVDTYGGSGGSIRGFLNDGSTDYNSHHNVDALAFGHCHYSYRNLGRHSRLRIKSSPTSFEVTVDDKDCFKTDKVSQSYYIAPFLFY
jgi:mannose-binding lectin 1